VRRWHLRRCFQRKLRHPRVSPPPAPTNVRPRLSSSTATFTPAHHPKAATSTMSTTKSDHRCHSCRAPHAAQPWKMCWGDATPSTGKTTPTSAAIVEAFAHEAPAQNLKMRTLARHHHCRRRPIIPYSSPVRGQTHGDWVPHALPPDGAPPPPRCHASLRRGRRRVLQLATAQTPGRRPSHTTTTLLSRRSAVLLEPRSPPCAIVCGRQAAARHSCLNPPVLTNAHVSGPQNL